MDSELIKSRSSKKPAGAQLEALLEEICSVGALGASSFSSQTCGSPEQYQTECKRRKEIFQSQFREKARASTVEVDAFRNKLEELQNEIASIASAFSNDVAGNLGAQISNALQNSLRKNDGLISSEAAWLVTAGAIKAYGVAFSSSRDEAMIASMVDITRGFKKAFKTEWGRGVLTLAAIAKGVDIKSARLISELSKCSQLNSTGSAKDLTAQLTLLHGELKRMLEPLVNKKSILTSTLNTTQGDLLDLSGRGRVGPFRLLILATETFHHVTKASDKLAASFDGMYQILDRIKFAQIERLACEMRNAWAAECSAFAAWRPPLPSEANAPSPKSPTSTAAAPAAPALKDATIHHRVEAPPSGTANATAEESKIISRQLVVDERQRALLARSMQDFGIPANIARETAGEILSQLPLVEILKQYKEVEALIQLDIFNSTEFRKGLFSQVTLWKMFGRVEFQEYFNQLAEAAGMAASLTNQGRLPDELSPLRFPDRYTNNELLPTTEATLLELRDNPGAGRTSAPQAVRQLSPIEEFRFHLNAFAKRVGGIDTRELNIVEKMLVTGFSFSGDRFEAGNRLKIDLLLQNVNRDGVLNVASGELKKIVAKWTTFGALSPGRGGDTSFISRNSRKGRTDCEDPDLRRCLELASEYSGGIYKAQPTR